MQTPTRERAPEPGQPRSSGLRRQKLTRPERQKETQATALSRAARALGELDEEDLHRTPCRTLWPG